MSYKKKDAVRLAWEDNRDQVKVDLRKVLRRLENEVMDVMDRNFSKALSEGRLLQLRPGAKAIVDIVKREAAALPTGDYEE